MQLTKCRTGTCGVAYGHTPGSTEDVACMSKVVSSAGGGRSPLLDRVGPPAGPSVREPSADPGPYFEDELADLLDGGDEFDPGPEPDPEPEPEPVRLTKPVPLTPPDAPPSVSCANPSVCFGDDGEHEHVEGSAAHARCERTSAWVRPDEPRGVPAWVPLPPRVRRLADAVARFAGAPLTRSVGRVGARAVRSLPVGVSLTLGVLGLGAAVSLASAFGVARTAPVAYRAGRVAFARARVRGGRAYSGGSPIVSRTSPTPTPDAPGLPAAPRFRAGPGGVTEGTSLADEVFEK